MDLKLIEDLLKKYYGGETSLEEEEQLKKFFDQDEISEHLKLEQLKFRYYLAAQKEKPEKQDFEKEILNTNTDKAAPRVIPLKQYFKTVSGIAASLLLIIGIYFIANKENPSKRKEMYVKYENPKMAYAETRKALLLISEKLNKGTKDLKKISKLNETHNSLTNKN